MAQLDACAGQRCCEQFLTPQGKLCIPHLPGWGTSGEEASAWAGAVAAMQQACTKLCTVVCVLCGIPAGPQQLCFGQI